MSSSSSSSIMFLSSRMPPIQRKEEFSEANRLRKVDLELPLYVERIIDDTLRRLDSMATYPPVRNIK